MSAAKMNQLMRKSRAVFHTKRGSAYPTPYATAATLTKAFFMGDHYAR